MPPKKQLTLDELKTKVLAKATKTTPRTGAEIAERMKLGYDARGIGRSLGALVRDGKLTKSSDRKPKYTKVD